MLLVSVSVRPRRRISLRVAGTRLLMEQFAVEGDAATVSEIEF